MAPSYPRSPPPTRGCSLTPQTLALVSSQEYLLGNPGEIGVGPYSTDDGPEGSGGKRSACHTPKKQQPAPRHNLLPAQRQCWVPPTSPANPEDGKVTSAQSFRNQYQLAPWQPLGACLGLVILQASSVILRGRKLPHGGATAMAGGGRSSQSNLQPRPGTVETRQEVPELHNFLQPQTLHLHLP